MGSSARFLLLLASLVLPLVGQSTSYVPDNVPGVGTCNVIPFGQGTYTYVGRVPAAFLFPQDQYLNEISFAPCGTGTLTAATVIIGVGHVSSTLPLPFTFPTGTSIGSFLDFTVIYDSAVQGPLNWGVSQDTWSPLGFAANGGTNFCWNGNDDIGIYITFQGLTVTGWSGSFHRTSTEPFRLYATGFQAPASTGTGAAGLKMALDFLACGPVEYQVNQAGSSLTANGVSGGPSNLASVMLAIGAPVTFSSSATGVGLPFEVALGLVPPLPASGGALMLPDGQLLNVDLGSPVLYLNGFANPAFLPYPGPFAASFSSSVGLYLAPQQLVADPTLPLGIALSQPCELLIQ